MPTLPPLSNESSLTPEDLPKEEESKSEDDRLCAILSLGIGAFFSLGYDSSVFLTLLRLLLLLYLSQSLSFLVGLFRGFLLGPEAILLLT
jgi:hypothetical protein